MATDSRSPLGWLYNLAAPGTAAQLDKWKLRLHFDTIAAIDHTVCARPGSADNPGAAIRMKDDMRFTFYGFEHFERSFELLQLQLAIRASTAGGGRSV